jgi:dolichol-phosphate mannosyltransferase
MPGVGPVIPAFPPKAMTEPSPAPSPNTRPMLPALPATEAPELSVVIPFYNEAANLASVLGELRTLLDGAGLRYEVLAINDGSRDTTGVLLDELGTSWPQLKPLHQTRNQGQAAALWAGFQTVRAPLVAVLDGDGQNDPSCLPAMITRLHETGADMVAGVRAKRQDSWLRKRMSRLANRVRQFFLKDGVSDSGCALKVMRREVLESFLPLRTLYSFMPALATSAGYRVVEMPVPHRPRTAGVSNYGLLAMLWRPAIDMLGIAWLSSRRFPTRNQPAGEAAAARNPWASLWIWVLPVMLFFVLGQRGLNEPDEGRYAEIAREMVASGDWLVPHLNGFEHFQKPPLIYWSTALMFKAFGFNEWAARLPSALAAWGTVILVFFMTRRLLGSARAHLACTLLMSMLGVFITARLLIPDTTMTFWIVAAITALVHQRRWAFFVAMGLGFLTKGPMALVVPIAAALGQSLAGGIRPNWPWIRGLALTLAIGLSWFIVMAAQRPELFDYFVRYELLERVASKAHGRAKPWWFFAPVLLVALLPWSLSLPGLARSAWTRIRARALLPHHGLLLGWVALPVLILSLAGSKLPTYILPLLPAFAIAFSARWPDARRVWRVALPAIALWTGIILASGAGNDALGRQASLRNLSATLLHRLESQPGEVFVCATRAHGLEFYLRQMVSTTRPEADIVLPLSPAQGVRVYQNPRDCGAQLKDRMAYGVMQRGAFDRYFLPQGWQILGHDGDFVLVTQGPTPIRPAS